MCGKVCASIRKLMARYSNALFKRWCVASYICGKTIRMATRSFQCTLWRANGSMLRGKISARALRWQQWSWTTLPWEGSQYCASTPTLCEMGEQMRWRYRVTRTHKCRKWASGKEPLSKNTLEKNLCVCVTQQECWPIWNGLSSSSTFPEMLITISLQNASNQITPHYQWL